MMRWSVITMAERTEDFQMCDRHVQEKRRGGGGGGEGWRRRKRPFGPVKRIRTTHVVSSPEPNPKLRPLGTLLYFAGTLLR